MREVDFQKGDHIGDLEAAKRGKCFAGTISSASSEGYWILMAGGGATRIPVKNAVSLTELAEMLESDNECV